MLSRKSTVLLLVIVCIMATSFNAIAESHSIPVVMGPATVKSTNTIIINGAQTDFPAVKIVWENYLKLRDIAMILKGTEKQFGISFSEETGVIDIITGDQL